MVIFGALTYDGRTVIKEVSNTYWLYLFEFSLLFRLLFQKEPNATECHMFITKYELYYPNALRVLIAWCT